MSIKSKYMDNRKSMFNVGASARIEQLGWKGSRQTRALPFALTGIDQQQQQQRRVRVAQRGQKLIKRFYNLNRKISLIIPFLLLSLASSALAVGG